MFKRRELTNGQADLLFLALLAILYVLFGLTEFVFSPPFGIHFMRQTDGLAFAMNYHLFDNSFWKPELLSVRWANGQAANEFPILYYLTSFCYDAFGVSHFWLRAINLSLFTAGLIWLQRLAYLIFESRAYSFVIGTFLFCSTIVLFYSANHLPDVPAMSLILGGIYFWFKHQKSKRPIDIIFSFALFTFAGLLKVTMMIYPIAIVSVSIIQKLMSMTDGKRINLKLLMINVAICFFIVFGWNYYMLQFNIEAGSNAFLTRALPVWEYEEWFITMVWGFIAEYWAVSVLPLTFWHILFILFAFQIIFIKHANRQLALLTSLTFAGSIAYMALFYAQFENHDYYFIVVMPTIILLLMNAFTTIKNLIPKIGNSVVYKVLLVVFIGIGMADSHHKLSKRFESLPITDHHVQMSGIQSALTDLNIPVEARFLVLGDFSPNGSLYFLQRKGITYKNQERLEARGIDNLSEYDLDYMLVLHNNWESDIPSSIVRKVVLSSERYSIYGL
jgi:hypothetical protein